MLKASVNVSKSDKGILLTRGLDVVEINGVDNYRDLENYLDSTGSDLKGSLEQLGFINSATAAEIKEAEEIGIDTMAFYEKHKAYAMQVLQPVFDHGIWDKLIDSNASRSLIIGFALEKYHYIEAAHEHMAYAAAYASPTMMPHLARHFIEEYTHGDIYKYGLSKFFSAEQIENSVPLPSTRSLVNALNEFSMADSFCYYAANEVLQLTENVDDNDEAEVGEFYEIMLKNHPWTEPLIKSFRAHTALDQSLGHEDSFKKMCASMGTISLNQANTAINFTSRIAEHLAIFLDGIDFFYSREGSPLRTHVIAKTV